MNRIAIVSDTHCKGVISLANKLSNMDLDLLIFLGDMFEDGEILENKTGLKTINILGNNDYSLEIL